MPGGVVQLVESSVSININTRLVRLGLGCIQPASADDISKFLGLALEVGERPVSSESIQLILDDWSKKKEVVCVHRRNNLFSLTRHGDSKLNLTERRLRDRTRLFLIKELRGVKLKTPEVKDTEKADVSSAVLFDSATQEERPVGAAGVAPLHRTVCISRRMSRTSMISVSDF
jgi:hypothetical protein